MGRAAAKYNATIRTYDIWVEQLLRGLYKSMLQMYNHVLVGRMCSIVDLAYGQNLWSMSNLRR